ncbi:uncharacterized protein LOC26514898 [Drosophila ananassae]|uniref:uncharacterized protein LOC26514898 n=1 Tax=Drosophila ananassae TaxID=7217 RepID=UPI001CFF7194|nr:uncharacterized protein LOC26514898 [Drosophila ananassae]
MEKAKKHGDTFPGGRQVDLLEAFRRRRWNSWKRRQTVLGSGWGSNGGVAGKKSAATRWQQLRRKVASTSATSQHQTGVRTATLIGPRHFHGTSIWKGDGGGMASDWRCGQRCRRSVGVA